jgi:hypothetical protein
VHLIAQEDLLFFLILNHEVSMHNFFPERLSAYPWEGVVAYSPHGTPKIDGEHRIGYP